MNRPEIITEPSFDSDSDEIKYLRKQLSKERSRRYDAEHELNKESTLRACVRDPTDIDFDKLSIIDKRLFAHTNWNKLSDKQKRTFVDKDFKDAEEIYKLKVKERMSDPIKMKEYFLNASAPILDNMIDMATNPSIKLASDGFAFREVWEVLRGILNSTKNKATPLDLRNKDISQQVDEILTSVTAGDITFDEAKEYISIVSSGFNLQELPKLMAKLELIESK